MMKRGDRSGRKRIGSGGGGETEGEEMMKKRRRSGKESIGSGG